jgi:hypothetical protein
VTSAEDVGPGSLRQAVLDANANPGPDAIAFDIGGGGVQTIRPASALPAVADPVVLDGTTQPGFVGSPLIVLDGSCAGAGANGLTITAGGSTVRGLVIGAFGGSGIALRTNGGDLIAGNWIGTDATGTRRLGNGTGVSIASNNNAVGGTAAGDGNTVSGNTQYGVSIAGSGNVVQGNLIGTDATGTRALGNGTGVVNGVGVFINGSNNVVGGTAAGAGNTISGNRPYGVEIQLAGGGNVVQGNKIGTDATGTAPLPNRLGVVIISSRNTVGGTEAGAGNTISGNLSYGVDIESVAANGNVVQGNRIGTDATGTAPLPNGTGVLIAGSSNNAVGGPQPGAGNTIAFNRGDGVLVNSGTGNAILHNAIFGNDHLDIELTQGGNHNQPAPALTSATSAKGVTTVQGTLQAQPSTTYTVELFTNSTCDPSGFGQGERFLGCLAVTTDADGFADFTASPDVAVDPGEFLTATATDPGNDTSAFSNCAEVTGPAPAAVPAASPEATPGGAAGAGWAAPSPTAAPCTLAALDPPANTASAFAPGRTSAAGSCPPWRGLDLVFEALGRDLENSAR